VVDQSEIAHKREEINQRLPTNAKNQSAIAAILQSAAIMRNNTPIFLHHGCNYIRKYTG
jgi:hypothetical protein